MIHRMMRSTLATLCAVAVALVISAVSHVSIAHAATSANFTAETVPSYSNPVTGSIEDSAGQSNVALAESMVTGCTYPAAFVEKDTAGNVFVTLRFKLADQMGAMTFWADNAGGGVFSEVAAEQMQTTTVGDATVADWRFQVPSEASNIRVSMYVNPMSRAVVYFVQLANLVEGNTDAVPFVESVVPGEEAAEPASATSAETSAATAGTSASATTEAAPSTDSAANSGVKEYNADGQETTEGSQSATLDGGTTAAIVAGIVVVVAIAGVVAYFAYLKPKRAKQAAAAAAAASAAKPKGK